MLKKIFIIFIISGFNLNLIIASSITGCIAIDTTWAPVIYLSAINSFDDLNTASYDFLIYESEIDVNGNFEMLNMELPEENRLYRLHICKKEDPVSTIIIGGKNENFIHFIMNNQSDINIISSPNSDLFKEIIVRGHSANKSLNKLIEIQKELISPPSLPSLQNRKLTRENVLNDFKYLADTSSFSIIKLLAVYFVNESFSYSEHLNFAKKIVLNLQNQDTSNPYYLAFKKEFEYAKFQNQATSRNISYWFISIGIIIIFVIIFLLFYIINRKNNSNFKNNNSQLISLLSLQEKKVLDLLRQGKSNKEISSELHIEVSTVKSHLNKIYARLGVKSRKEIINSNW